MSELILKDVAVEAIERRLSDLEELTQTKRDVAEGGMMVGYHESQQIIKSLPPVEQKNGWIPAKEIQPEPGERVLVYVNEESLLDFDEIYKPYIGMYIAEGDWGVYIDDDPGMRLMNSNAVIAWMPITPYDSVEAVKALKEVKDKTTSHVAWILMEKRKPKSRQRVLYLYEMGDDGLRKQYSVESDYANRELNKIAKAWMPFIPFKE